MHSSDISMYLRLLNEARDRVATDEHEYICCAISDAAEDHGFGYFGEDAEYLRNKVEDTIYPHSCMERWAISRELPHSYADMKKMRLAFLDKWIAQTENDLAKAKKREVR